MICEAFVSKIVLYFVYYLWFTSASRIRIRDPADAN